MKCYVDMQCMQLCINYTYYVYICHALPTEFSGYVLRQSGVNKPASAIFCTSSGSARATISAGRPSITARACKNNNITWIMTQICVEYHYMESWVVTIFMMIWDMEAMHTDHQPEIWACRALAVLARCCGLENAQGDHDYLNLLDSLSIKRFYEVTGDRRSCDFVTQERDRFAGVMGCNWLFGDAVQLSKNQIWCNRTLCMYSLSIKRLYEVTGERDRFVGMMSCTGLSAAAAATANCKEPFIRPS